MKRILVIDDEKDFNYFLKKNLEEEKFEVITCSDSRKGFELAKKEKPDLILLDILMPEVDGMQIAENLKSDKVTKDIPIVFITAAVTRKEVEEEKNFIGGQYFVAKPVQVKEIVMMIKKLTN